MKATEVAALLTALVSEKLGELAQDVVDGLPEDWQDQAAEALLEPWRQRDRAIIEYICRAKAAGEYCEASFWVEEHHERSDGYTEYLIKIKLPDGWIPTPETLSLQDAETYKDAFEDGYNAFFSLPLQPLLENFADDVIEMYGPDCLPAFIAWLRQYTQRLEEVWHSAQRRQDLS